MTSFVGILDGSGATWSIRIPDLPGCYGAGASADAALDDVTSAAREWIAHRMSKGGHPVKPRTLQQVLSAGEIDAVNGEAPVIVPVIVDTGRTVRANLTFEAGLLEAVDAEARRRGLTRSAFFASAARERLGQG